MEISYPSHSHIIGRGGQNVNKVMNETRTKIHFPDENRQAGEEKSNLVTIDGELGAVEKARQRIRVHITFFFSVISLLLICTFCFF